jgi:hypothetical protein
MTTQIHQNEQIPQNGYDTRLRRRLLALQKQQKQQKQQKVQNALSSKHHYYLRSTRPLYEVNIDFDEASAAWNRNKRRVGQSYEYIA